MTTEATIRAYFDHLKHKRHWAEFLADDMSFTSFVSPIKQVAGRLAFIESTKRFYHSIANLTVKELLVSNESACALTQYELRTPQGQTFESHIAEVFTVHQGKITRFDIYFDNTPFPK